MSRISSRLVQFVLAFSFVAMGAVECPTSSADRDEARAAMLRRDYTTAESPYRRVLERNPASAELLTDLGVALQMQGRSTEAIQAFEQALKRRYLPRTYALLAQEYCVSRDLDDAKPMLRRIVKEDSGETKILAVVAPCFLDADEPVESVEAYTALLRDDSYPQDLALIRLAKSYLAAAQLFVSKLTAKPGNSEYVQALEDAKASAGARGAFLKAQRESRNFQPALSFEQALAIWNRHPDDTALLYQLAVISGELSMKQVELCRQRYPDSPYLAQLEFEMLADQGKEDAAARGFEELLHSHPELPDLRFDLGMLYRKERDWDKALAVFRQELDANPQDERAAARVSEALDQMTRWQELRDFLAPRIQQKSPPLWACLDFAKALEHLGENREAIHVLATALARYPSSKAVHWRLLHLYRLSGDMQKASAEAKWFKSQPE
jgi:tetratricopeptide (TPR) repeat protein